MWGKVAIKCWALIVSNMVLKPSNCWSKKELELFAWSIQSANAALWAGSEGELFFLPTQVIPARCCAASRIKVVRFCRSWGEPSSYLAPIGSGGRLLVKFNETGFSATKKKPDKLINRFWMWFVSTEYPTDAGDVGKDRSVTGTRPLRS